MFIFNFYKELSFIFGSIVTHRTKMSSSGSLEAELKFKLRMSTTSLFHRHQRYKIEVRNHTILSPFF